jgi:hypothetical protein
MVTTHFARSEQGRDPQNIEQLATARAEQGHPTMLQGLGLYPQAIWYALKTSLINVFLVRTSNFLKERLTCAAFYLQVNSITTLK